MRAKGSLNIEMATELFTKESPSGMLFGIASVLGLVFTIVYTLASVYAGSFDLSAISIIISLGIVNGILATICIILTRDNYGLSGRKTSSDISLIETKNQLLNISRELKTEKEKLDELTFLIHNIQDQLRDRVVELSAFLEAIIADKEFVPEQADIIDALRITRQFNLYLVNNIKDIFDSLTGDTCSACIKIIDINDDDEFVVQTLMRDTKSFRERKSNDGLLNAPFPWYENTAFKMILSNEMSDSYYVCDDLRKEQTYINLNKNWNKFYNATLVAPIRIHLSDSNFDEDIDSNVIGFICVDNKKGGFDSQSSIESMASIADSLFTYFNVSGRLLDQATTRLKEENMRKAKEGGKSTEKQ